METLERIQPNRQVTTFILMVFLSQANPAPIRYSVLEETESGSFIAHLTKDLGLGIGELTCLTLGDPIDSSPPGSPVPKNLQARTLEWVAISFSNA